MTIGFVYDLKEDYNIEDSYYKDFSYLTEIEYVKRSLQLAGYSVIDIGSPAKFIHRLLDKEPVGDIIFNMAEGFYSRNREGLVPALCELCHLPYTGSDSFSLSLSLHKYQTLQFIKGLGIRVPASLLYDTALDQSENEIKLKNISFPMIIKPNHEGSSMGVKRCLNQKQLIDELKKESRIYQQEILVQEYIDGYDASVCILEVNGKPQIWGITQFTTLDYQPILLFDQHMKIQDNHHMLTAQFIPDVINILRKDSLLVHKALHFRDVSRIDWKVSSEGIPYFLEATPLPDYMPGAEFDFLAKQQGSTFTYVIDQILKSAQKRYALVP